MNDLPLELVQTVAQYAPVVLLLCRKNAAILQCQHARYDLMIAAGIHVRVRSYDITWFRHGLVHRTDGPAYENIYGVVIYAVDGRRHRLDGPAFTGYGVTEYFINGEQCSYLYHSMFSTAPRFFRWLCHRPLICSFEN